MRIIAGYLGGRTFSAPQGHKTHPMSEKMRGALFNALGDISGLTVLDPFAGSGAVSFEALSRGAAHVTAIEIDKPAHLTIANNIKELGIDTQKITLVHANSGSWTKRYKNKTFDIVIADPPYQFEKINFISLERLVEHVNVGGMYILSISPTLRDWSDHGMAQIKSVELIQSKDYGDSQLVFYRKVA